MIKEAKANQIVEANKESSSASISKSAAGAEVGVAGAEVGVGRENA